MFDGMASDLFRVWLVTVLLVFAVGFGAGYGCHAMPSIHVSVKRETP